MSDQRLRELFNDLADTVPAPQLAEATVQGAHRVRRQRCAALVAAVTAGVAVTVIAVSVGSAPQPISRVATPPAASASPTQFGPMIVDVAPVGAEGKLQRLDTALPSQIALDPRRAAKLSAAPIDGAVALLQSAEDQTSVYVLGSDRLLRVLDTVRLKAPEDAFGNAQGVLDSTSLAPDGKRAAFAQRDEVVIVDLTTGKVERLPVRGFNENVLWQPDALGLIVEQADATYLVDVRGAKRQTYASFDSVASNGETADDIVRLGTADGPGSALSRWTLGGELVTRIRLPAPWLAVEDWYGTGWRNGGLVARSLFAPMALEPSGAGEAILAVDVTSAKIVRALLFPRDPGNGGGRWLQCCHVRGWLGPDIVVVQSMNRLLAWNVRTGALHLVTQLAPGTGTLSLADLGRR